MLRSSVLILFLPRLFLEEVLRDIPIFFSSFPARSFGIELEYNGGVLRKIPEICLRFSGSAHFSKRGKAEKTEYLHGQIWNKKDLMQHSKVLHKVSFFRFSWEVSGCANVPFSGGQRMCEIPKNMVIIPTRKMKLNSKRFCLGDLIPFDFS